MTKIDKGIRSTNYMIDLSFTLFIWIVITLLFPNLSYGNWTFYVVTFCYYMIMETLFSQTFGKMATKTIVTQSNGDKPKFISILLRSVIRITPFDISSYLFGTEHGLHDTLSSTKLIKKQ